MRLFSKLVWTVGVLALVAGPAAAQFRGRTQPGGGGDIVSLLRNPQIQKELGISEEDVAKVPAAVLEALGKILKPEQVKRLKEIALQRQGIRALSDPKVQEALNLKEEQKKEIKTVQEDARKEMTELFQGARGGGGAGNRQGSREKLDKLNKETEKKIESILTSSQQKKWKEMLGTPFKFEPQQGRTSRRRQDQ